jgi:ribosomal protein L37AE/L43A
MCCDPTDDNDNEAVGECPECGAEIDKNGDSIIWSCKWSPACETCGDAPCDGSC